MSGLSKVTVTRQNGNLGATPPNNDGESLLLITANQSGSPQTWWGTVPGSYTSIEQFDLKNPASVYSDKVARATIRQNVKHFFLNAKNQTLHVEILSAALDYNSTSLITSLKTAVRAKNGKIKLVGIVLNPSYLYVYSATNFSRGNIETGVPLINVAVNELAAEGFPCHVFIDSRPSNFQTGLLNMRTLASQNVTAIAFQHYGEKQETVADWGTLSATESGFLSVQAHVGYVLGVAAGLPVQRNIARVANGQLNLGGVYNQGSFYGVITASQVVDLGYVMDVQHPGLDGYYLNDDPTCTALTDDFAWVHRNRIINKAASIARKEYTQKLNDEIAVDPTTGYISKVAAKAFETLVKSAIEQQMVNKGEAVAVEVYVNPEQDVLTTSTINVVLSILPYAMAKYINVTVQFTKTIV